jgi:hypothetical protein
MAQRNGRRNIYKSGILQQWDRHRPGVLLMTHRMRFLGQDERNVAISKLDRLAGDPGNADVTFGDRIEMDRFGMRHPHGPTGAKIDEAPALASKFEDVQKFGKRPVHIALITPVRWAAGLR